MDSFLHGTEKDNLRSYGQTAVMSDGFTKVKISLVLRVVHLCLIHPLKAQIFVYLMMYGKS